MKNHLQNSSFFRNEELNSLNEAVLNIIHHKKYPLNYHPVNNPHIPNHYHLRKLSTTPSQLFQQSSIQKLKSGLTGGQWQHKSKKEYNDQRSMGEHLQTMLGKQLQLPYASSQSFDQVNKKINDYLWQKKKERAIFTSKNDIERDSYCRTRNQKTQQVQKNKPLYSLSKLLKTFRKNLIDQLTTQQEQSQMEPVNNINIKPQKMQLRPIDFYQGQKERGQLARKYPIKGGRSRLDLNKQLVVDMTSDLKENQCNGDEKYNKMRIMANHKKIISLGL